MIKNFGILITLCLLTMTAIQSKPANPGLAYTLSMNEPHKHYFEVEIVISDIRNRAFIDLSMPAWTPGSYKIRDFSRHVDFFNAEDRQANSLNFEKISKNTWRIHSNHNNEVFVRYKVYAHERSVRTSFLDSSHGFIDGSSVFMYIEDIPELPSELTIHPYKTWTKISTALQEIPGTQWQYAVPSFYFLADSPIEIGNHQVINFEAGGIPHEIAIYGDGNYQSERLRDDTRKIVETCTNVFGVNPLEKYVFIIHNQLHRTGGLEHANATTLQVNRWSYRPEESYISRILGLIAHEYFHVWNVKRLKPLELDQIDYSRENYTRLLWIMEGFTKYYDGLILRRAGFIDEETYLNKLASAIGIVENRPGNDVQSVSDASFDAWIKAYQPHENSFNTTVSYYAKGGLLAAMLDLEILSQTKGNKRLDDIMRYLYQEYFVDQKRGITGDDLIQAVKMVAGINLKDFFERYIRGTEEVDYQKYLNHAGLKLVREGTQNNLYNFGISTTMIPSGARETLNDTEGKLIVQSVIRGSSAYEGGVNAGDEIIAVDGFRVDAGLFQNLIYMKRVGDQVKLTIARDGVMLDLTITLIEDPFAEYQIVEDSNISDNQRFIYKKWLSNPGNH